MNSNRGKKDVKALREQFKTYRDALEQARKDANSESEFNLINPVIAEQILSDEKLMQEVAIIQENPENMQIALKNVSEDKFLKDFPAIQKMIAKAAEIPVLLEKLKEKVDENVMANIRQASDHIINGSDIIYRQTVLMTSGQVVPSVPGILGTFSFLSKVSVMLAASGAACIHAHQKQEFSYWLTQEFVKRKMVMDDMAILNRLFITQQHEIVPEESLQRMENLIWSLPEFNLRGEKIAKLSTEKYRKKLMASFEKLYSYQTLKPHEKELISELEKYDIMTIQLLLERKHAEERLDKYENDIYNRIIAKSFRQDADLAKVTGMLTLWHNHAPELLASRNSSENKFDTLIENIASTGTVREPDQEEIGQAIEQDELIQQKMELNAVNRKKEFIAKSFLLIAAVIAVTMAVLGIVGASVSVPGFAPAMIGLGVIIVAAVAIAYLIKPDIFKKLGEDFSSFTEEIADHYKRWKETRDIKKQIKTSSSINPVDLEKEVNKLQQTIERLLANKKRLSLFSDTENNKLAELNSVLTKVNDIKNMDASSLNDLTISIQKCVNKLGTDLKDKNLSEIIKSAKKIQTNLRALKTSDFPSPKSSKYNHI